MLPESGPDLPGNSTLTFLDNSIPTGRRIFDLGCFSMIYRTVDIISFELNEMCRILNFDFV